MRDGVEQVLAEGIEVLDCTTELQKLGSEIVFNDVDALVRGRYLRTLPGVHPGDGFFAAVLTRR